LDRFASARVRVRSCSAGRLELEVEAPGDAFIVASEIAYEPGWKVTVDGKETRDYRVDHVLQGCEVPSGTHTVVWAARSTAGGRGRDVSRAAAGLCLLLAGVGWLLERRRTQPSASK
jgi:hypothetical protein